MPPNRSETPKITPVILAGGQGSRLWPLTSSKRPKPFLKVFSGRSLLQKTVWRVRGKYFDAPVFVTEERNRKRLIRDLTEIGMDSGRFIFEEEARNTAPAITAAALCLRDDNPLILVMPSDHDMTQPEAFRDLVYQAAQLHADGSITIFGISPRKASRHFGYIIPDADGRQVRRFIEKPDEKTANALIIQENALWHSGMFLCRADDLCKLIERHDPPLFGSVKAGLREIKAWKKKGEITMRTDECVNIPSISFDYAILEKVGPRNVFTLHLHWSDVGTRLALLMSVLRRLTIK